MQTLYKKTNEQIERRLINKIKKSKPVLIVKCNAAGELIFMQPKPLKKTV